MRPGSNAIEAAIISEKCNGLLISEDHFGFVSGQDTLCPSREMFLDRMGLSSPAGTFIRCVSMWVNGIQLHAIVDLSRRLGNSC
jgi:hypothetical protein